MRLLRLTSSGPPRTSIGMSKDFQPRPGRPGKPAHRRFHTATHLLCALVPHPVDGCSITAGYARLDFHMTEPLDKDVLTAGIARLVAAASVCDGLIKGLRHPDWPAEPWEALRRLVLMLLQAVTPVPRGGPQLRLALA